MSDDLKPCPFCRGEATLHQGMAAFNDYEVHCDACGVTGPNYGSMDETFSPRDDAVHHWNTRADDWQPIETAPKDGTWFLACRFFDGVSFVIRVVHWSDDFDEWMVSHDGFFTAPTHWMPLPEAPQ